MTVIRQWNAGTSAWEVVLVGAQGPQGAQGSSGGVSNNLLTNVYSLPGVVFSGEQSNNSITANGINYMPFVVTADLTITKVSVYVQTASATSGCKTRLAIYNSSLGWVPSTLVLDAGEVTCDSVGNKSITVSQTLTPGLYFLRTHGDGSASRPSFYGYRGSVITGTWLGTNTQFHYNYTASKTYAVAENPASPTPGLGGTSSAPFIYFARLQWN